MKNYLIICGILFTTCVTQALGWNATTTVSNRSIEEIHVITTGPFHSIWSPFGVRINEGTYTSLMNPGQYATKTIPIDPNATWRFPMRQSITIFIPGITYPYSIQVAEVVLPIISDRDCGEGEIKHLVEPHKLNVEIVKHGRCNTEFIVK